MTRPQIRQLWGVALGGIIVSLTLLLFGRGKAAPGGVPLEFSTTIVPADESDLDCDATVSLDGHRCAFTKGGPLPELRGAALRPFVTVAGEVVVLSGLFEDPGVSRALVLARQRRIDSRFRVDCRASYLGVIDQVGVRWRKQDRFEARKNVRAARVEACAIHGSQSDAR